MSDGGDHLFRAVGGTEYSWCRAVPGGTGITVLALLVSKQPDVAIVQNALRTILTSHPILNTKLHFDPATKTFSFLSHPTPNLRIQPFDLQSTAEILQGAENDAASPFQLILEHELNKNSWRNLDDASYADTDVFFASLYCLGEARWALMLRLHTGACDRAAAAALVRGLVRELAAEGVAGGVERGVEGSGEGSLGIEELIPKGKGDKPFWARGVDMLGYSLNSFRLSNAEFADATSPRLSRVVRLKLDLQDTERLLEVSDFTFLPLRRRRNLVLSREKHVVPSVKFLTLVFANLLNWHSNL